MIAEKQLFISGPSGQIEAVMTDLQSTRLAVICHPHSLHGGSMGNKVVTTIARMLNNLGVSTLRFNFRGVGESAGVFSDGIGEQDDLKAVLNYATELLAPKQIMLAGFSFGSFVSYEVAREIQPDILLSIAPPVEHFRFGSQPKINTWIVVQSDDDEIVPSKDVYRWIDACNPPPELIRFEKAGHFFHGQLTVLRDRLIPLMERAWP